LLPLGALLWLAIGTRFAVPAMAVSLGYASIWLSTFRFGPLREFTNANDYSYATYLYHYPVAQAVLHFVPGMHVIPLIGITAGIVLPLAFLSWELIERPALALRKRFQRGTGQVAAVDVGIPKVSAARVMRPAPRAAKPAVETLADGAGFDAALAAAQAKPAPAVPTANADTPAVAKPAATEAMAAPVMAAPSMAARVWRPMPTRRSLSIMPEMPLISGYVVDDPVKPARTERPVAPSQPQRIMTARKQSAASDMPDVVHAAVISKSRMAMVTKRPAQIPLPPEEPRAAIEPGRAVVAVDDEEGPLSRRAAPPRPTWQRLGATPV
jgi:hypothetical protein